MSSSFQCFRIIKILKTLISGEIQFTFLEISRFVSSDCCLRIYQTLRTRWARCRLSDLRGSLINGNSKWASCSELTELRGMEGGIDSSVFLMGRRSRTMTWILWISLSAVGFLLQIIILILGFIKKVFLKIDRLISFLSKVMVRKMEMRNSLISCLKIYFQSIVLIRFISSLKLLRILSLWFKLNEKESCNRNSFRARRIKLEVRQLDRTLCQSKLSFVKNSVISEVIMTSIPTLKRKIGSIFLIN